MWKGYDGRGDVEDGRELPNAEARHLERRKKKHPMTFAVQFHNESPDVGPEAFATFCAAFVKQIAEDFCPSWRMQVPGVVAGGPVQADAYHVHVLQKSTDPGALGYHDVDDQGKPRGFVFTEEGSWTVTASHEGLELLGDRYCATWVMTADGKMRAYEACDAVEQDTYTKKVGDEEVELSNFVTPEYFADQPVEGAKTDFLDKLHGQIAPARTPGGYDLVIDTRGQVSQEFSRHLAAMAPEKRARKQGQHSRTSRRLKQAARLAEAHDA